MELPSYHLPKLSVVLHKVKEEVWAYIRKATGIVLWAMILLWSISYFPDGQIETSYMARGAKAIAPIYEPAGFGDRWECVASLPGSIIAKETIVGYFTTILHVESEAAPRQIDLAADLQLIGEKFLLAAKQSVQDTLFPNVHLQAEDDIQVSALRTLWTDEKAQLKAFCFMVYVLLSVPCIMTLQALYHEYGCKLMMLSVITMLLVPYLLAVMIYQGFSLLL